MIVRGVFLLVGVFYTFTMVAGVWWNVVYLDFAPHVSMNQPWPVQVAVWFASSMVTVFWSCLVAGLTYWLPIGGLLCWFGYEP